MRQSGIFPFTTAACVVLGVLSAGGTESRADMAVALVATSSDATGSPAGSPGLTAGMTSSGTSPGRGVELAPTPTVGAPVNAAAASGSSGNPLVTRLLNTMMMPGGSGGFSSSGTGSSSNNVGPGSDGNNNADVLAAVSSNGTVAAGGAGLLGPDFALGAQVGGTQMPLAAPEPSTLILVVAAVPFGWRFIRRRNAQAV